MEKNEPVNAATFTVTSSGIKDGVIADEYGKHGSQITDDIPTLSLPLEISGAPEGTVCYALTMLDPDAQPLCGYVWVHWLACGFMGTTLPANASIEMAAAMVQGKNSYDTMKYGGPAPPDKPHTYITTVYALDYRPELAEGFSQDELLLAIDGHVLATAELKATYPN